MERHRCKVCYRHFSNGRALGGHMRSHVAPSPRPARAAQQQPPSPSTSSSSFPAAEEEERAATAAATYSLRENPRRSCRLVDPEFSSSVAVAEGVAAGASPVIQDGESDVESSFRRRLSWPRRREDPSTDAEPLSSISDASPEEDVARCLMLLSRDAWSKSEAEAHHSNSWDETNEEEELYNEVEDEEEAPVAARSWRKRTRYQCSTCRKFFRSYQALGGHRASHKRVGVECILTAGIRVHGEDTSHANATDRHPKLFECPYCDRVFPSGQALGGHKRSHLSSASAIATASPARPLPPPRSTFAVVATASPARPLPPPRSTFTVNDGFIDLNLPAPLEEEEEEAEVSVLSVATK